MHRESLMWRKWMCSKLIKAINAKWIIKILKLRGEYIMKILVADTSSSVCITGVFEDDKLIAESCLDNGKRMVRS